MFAAAAWTVTRKNTVTTVEDTRYQAVTGL